MKKPEWINAENIWVGIKFSSLVIGLALFAVFALMPMGDRIQEARLPKYFKGTITDIKHNENWLWIIDTPDSYNMVIVNGTEELRLTFSEAQIEREVFGQVEKEPIFHVGDNVTITYVNFNEFIEHQIILGE